jgi:hypothetical protein
MGKILEPELFSRNFGPFNTPDPMSLDSYGFVLKNTLQPNVAFKSRASHSLVYVNM